MIEIVTAILALALVVQTFRLARSIRQAREYRAGWNKAVSDFVVEISQARISYLADLDALDAEYKDKLARISKPKVTTEGTASSAN